MSVSALFYLVSVVGAYQVGAYNVRHPDAFRLWGKELWSWIDKQRHSNRQG
jgi:hypothetical protein